MCIYIRNVQYGGAAQDLIYRIKRYFLKNKYLIYSNLVGFVLLQLQLKCLHF